MSILRNPEGVVAALRRSPFRRKFRLSSTEREYLREHGLGALLARARELVSQHLAPAAPINDGQQTPFRGDPIYVAQHGTATCCRRCLQKWHHIPTGQVLSADEENYIVSIITNWLQTQTRVPPGSANLTPTAA